MIISKTRVGFGPKLQSNFSKILNAAMLDLVGQKIYVARMTG